MSTFIEDEGSVEDSQPRELYEIKQNLAVTYYIATGARDIDYGGHTYVAMTAARTELTIATISNDSELTLSLPQSHPLVQRYHAKSSPPGQITVTIRTKQMRSGEVEQVFTGVISSCALEGHLAKFLVQSRFARALKRRLPTISASKRCPHTLYDTMCTVDRPTFQLGDDGPALTADVVNGRNITISSIGGQPDQWAKFGELVHIATGERMTILDQVGTAVVMQAPIPDMKTGDAILVAAGCAKDIDTCRDKFGNQQNFGGFPQLPTKNPFLTTGFGVVEHE